MTVIVTACSAFGLTVSQAKTKIMCLQTKDGGKVLSFAINAAAQVYKQRSSLCAWVGLSAQTENSGHIENAASSEGLGVLPAIQDGNL